MTEVDCATVAARRGIRVLYVPPRYAPHVGGVEEHCRGYAREMARRGHEVAICCAEDGPSPGMVDGIPVRRCRTAFTVANTNVTPGLPLHLAIAQADIIHTFLPTPWSADWAAITGKLLGTPVVVSYENDIVGRGMAGTVAVAYNWLMLPLTLHAAARILVLSDRYADTSPHLAPIRHKVQALPPGIDTTRFCPDNGPRWPATFFFLSVLDEYHRYKGLDVLFRALAVARRDNPAIRLIVGGSGSLRAEYERLAETLGISGNVEFRGYVGDAELLALYRRCAAFVLPSTSVAQEGFGIVAAEALACGAPVILSDVVGAAIQVGRANAGIVTPAGSVALLASALATTVAQPQSIANGNGRALAKSLFSAEVVGDRLEQVYRDLVDRRSARRC